MRGSPVNWIGNEDSPAKLPRTETAIRNGDGSEPRWDKVATLRALIARGEYRIPAEDLAERLLVSLCGRTGRVNIQRNRLRRQ
jgi:hypothetical protein